MVNEGDTAPSFTLPDQDGNPVSLDDQKGKWVVLWWYPKASTPGCTIEGQGFRDRASSFESAGAVILGISFDTPEENKAFQQAQDFPYRLLSDVDRAVGDTYGSKRADDDPMAVLPKRNTYLIDPDGVVHKVYEVQDVSVHPQRVLDDIAAQASA
jgi:peroxiredoxin Q/BCP